MRHMSQILAAEFLNLVEDLQLNHEFSVPSMICDFISKKLKVQTSTYHSFICIQMKYEGEKLPKTVAAQILTIQGYSL